MVVRQEVTIGLAGVLPLGLVILLQHQLNRHAVFQIFRILYLMVQTGPSQAMILWGCGFAEPTAVRFTTMKLESKVSRPLYW